MMTKTGIIAGLGETNDEIVETMRELRAHGVDVVTIGQYLQPSSKHVAIDRWVHPDEFRWLREQGEALGFGSVFAGPSYGRATAPTSRSTQPTPASASSPTGLSTAQRRRYRSGSRPRCIVRTHPHRARRRLPNIDPRDHR